MFEDYLVKRVYFDEGNCGPDGDNANWEICDKENFDCPPHIDNIECPTGKAFISRKEGDGTCESVTIDGCSYSYYVEYSCEPGRLGECVALISFLTKLKKVTS